LPLRAALLKGQYFEPLDIMQFYLTSFVVLLLQALGAPAMAQELAEKAVAAPASGELTPGSGTAAPFLVDGAEFHSAVRGWSLHVMRRAQRLYGDPAAGYLSQGFEGESHVKFQNSLAGRAQDCTVNKSSGHAALDHIACQAVMAIGGLPIARGEDGLAKPQWLVLPVVFVGGDKLELEEGAP
jgi:TonB family protein